MPTNAKYRVYRGLTAIESNTVQHCPLHKSPLTFEYKLLQNLMFIGPCIIVIVEE